VDAGDFDEDGFFRAISASGVRSLLIGRRALIALGWARRVSIDTGSGTAVDLPGLDDLIATKRFAARPKDAEDVRLLLRIKERLGS